MFKNYFKTKKKKKQILNEESAGLIKKVDIALTEIREMLSNKTVSIDPDIANSWKTRNVQLLNNPDLQNDEKYKRAIGYKVLLEKKVHLYNFVRNMDGIVLQHNNQVAKEKALNEASAGLVKKLDVALTKIREILSNKTASIDPDIANSWKTRNVQLLNNPDLQNDEKYKRAIGYKLLLEKRGQLYYFIRNMDGLVLEHNNRVAIRKISSAYELIGNVEGQKLDHQQMTCIVKEGHNHLVIAGAGTGKTTTVVGKIKYLLKSGKYKLEDILVLSFTNASASEMSDRIRKETGYSIEAITFHKLGLNIITKANKIAPKITKIDLPVFIRKQLQEYMKNDSYLHLLSTYLMYNRVVAKSEFDFKNKADYDEYLQINPPITMNNEPVKSYGEMDIANFLNENGINYIYEHPYEIDTRTSEYGQYNPDFYLPDYQIYIEYFGVNKQGEVPSYFKGSHGMTAKETYQAAIQWKRDTHKQNNTVMIERYAYEKFDNTLLANLKSSLENHEVKFTPKSSKELWQQASAEGKSVLEGLIELFMTIINLIKSNDYSIAHIRQLNKGGCNEQNNAVILRLVEPVFNSYFEFLKSQNEIDFGDMINMATNYVKTGKFKNSYKYVIIDEYQDISKARFSLLKAMRDSMDYDLFCVGDDWQSIYRFAGSDIGYILDFQKYWGFAEISRIETTYRFTNSLISISGEFIMQNPMQIQKQMKGISNDNRFALSEVNGYTEKSTVEFMSRKVEDLPTNCNVFFIGRYAFDAKLLTDSGLFTCCYNNQTSMVDVIYPRRPDLKMSFITAHKSKGLQADYVFIINNRKSRMGFPSKIQDDAIIDLLLNNADQFSHAEERRLFYVALTRAKKKAILLTVKNQESEFIKELKNKYADELKKEQFTCPLCDGSLRRKNGSYGEFFGCSNYINTGCKYTRKIVYGAGAKRKKV